jgi:manganese efflux pump family protein
VTLGFALAADAFAAALCQGAAADVSAKTTAWRVAAAFGAAQGLAPILGYGAGAALGPFMAAFDHWIAFAILGALGAKLIKEGITEGPEDAVSRSPATGVILLGIAVATSIDAAAAGITLQPMGLALAPTAAVIAGITFAACFVGALIGARLGRALGGGAEVLGGAALIGLGTKILHDHGAFA